LQNTLDQLSNQSELPIGDGMAGKLGVWEGEGQQPGISWSIRIDLKLDEQLIEYPSLSCGGTLALSEESDAQYEFGHIFKVVLINKALTAVEVVAYHNGRGSQKGIFAKLKYHNTLSYVPTRTWWVSQVDLLFAVMAHH
jgi:hypothetical protein